MLFAFKVRTLPEIRLLLVMLLVAVKEVLIPEICPELVISPAKIESWEVEVNLFLLINWFEALIIKLPDRLSIIPAELLVMSFVAVKEVMSPEICPELVMLFAFKVRKFPEIRLLLVISPAAFREALSPVIWPVFLMSLFAKREVFWAVKIPAFSISKLALRVISFLALSWAVFSMVIESPLLALMLIDWLFPLALFAVIFFLIKTIPSAEISTFPRSAIRLLSVLTPAPFSVAMMEICPARTPPKAVESITTENPSSALFLFRIFFESLFS